MQPTCVVQIADVLAQLQPASLLASQVGSADSQVAHVLPFPLNGRHIVRCHQENLSHY